MTATTDAKSIRYDRSTRDYRAEYEGQLVGFYGSYHAAEVALDAFVYELLSDTAVDTADMEAEQAALVSDEAPLLVAESRTRDVHTMVIERSLQATCRNCGAGHTIQKCPEVRALLFAPIVRRVLERVA